MESAVEHTDRNAVTPFLVKLFYRTGAFHRPDEFTAHPMDLPPHITIHTWPTATLLELTHLLAAHSPHILPNPSIGTRLVYRLLYHDTRNSSNTSSGTTASPSGPSSSSTTAPRLASQDLGSVVVGDGGPGIVVPTRINNDGDGDVRMDNDDTAATVENGGTGGHHAAATTMSSEADARKTLAAARFVAGDFLSVAILPPNAVDGSVQPASAARMGRGYGIGQATVGLSGLPPSHNGPGRERGYGYGRGRTLDSWTGGGMMHEGEGPNTVALPMGEWRRGEKLPDMPPPNRGRGKRRW